MAGRLVRATLVALIGAVCVSGRIEEMPMPPELESCLKNFQNKTSIINTVGEEIFSTCLNMFLFKTEKVKWGQCNLTKADQEFFLRMLNRSMRVEKSVPLPPSGFRTRQEYRRLTDKARDDFHKAVVELRNRGEYDLFACAHQGIVGTSGHGGPNFLGWHRVYITMYEEALRRINPTVSLPYWDSTLDFHMEEPTKSVIWTPSFMGKGSGIVNTGPFTDWLTPMGSLERYIGFDTINLISRDNVANVLSQCRTAQITTTTAQEQFDLELHHAAPHTWVGGQMSMLETAAFDPVFYLHHAFIDYIWQLFRNRQRKVCGVNPVTDYPPMPEEHQHAPKRPMDRFPMFRNIDGYADYWEKSWFSYEPTPTCQVFKHCNSPWLVCQNGICISKTAEESRTSVSRSYAENMTIAERSDDISLANKAYEPGTALVTPQQNSFFINGKADMTLWAFVPIQVIYMKPNDLTFPVYQVYNGQLDFNEDFYSNNYPELNKLISRGHPKEYPNCKRNPSGAGQIILQSNGINYVSRYNEYAIIDSRLPIGSSIVYMGVKNPKTENTEAIISAHDHCGRMCQPQCLDHGSNPPKYRPCSGAIRISSSSPKMYGNTLGEAIMDVWQRWGRDSRYSINTTQLVMLCSNNGNWPWK